MQVPNVLIGIGLAIIAYNGWVSIRLVRSDNFEKSQKRRQLLLIWILPVLGAVAVQSFMWADGRPPFKHEKGYTEPGANAS